MQRGCKGGQKSGVIRARQDAELAIRRDTARAGLPAAAGGRDRFDQAPRMQHAMTSAGPDSLDEFRSRVLETFTARAEKVGIRRVRMDDLASDLRVSKRTLYEAYASKEALVRAFIEAWSARIQDQVAYRRSTQASPMEQLERWVKNWSRGNGLISDVLWDDIRTYYPKLYLEYREARRVQMKDTTDAMRALMFPDIDHDVAIVMFDAIRRMAKDERVQRHLGMSLEEVLMKSVEIWARGAYAAPNERKQPDNCET